MSGRPSAPPPPAGPTVDEALNQREFEAARQQWLNSGQAKTTPTQQAATTVSVTRKGSAQRKAKLPAHADLLLAETKKMDERLALLRRTMAAEKEKRETAALAAAVRGGPGSRGLLATQRIGSGTTARYVNVASRIDNRNTLLSVKESAAREAKVAEAARARAAAEEARKMALLRAQGHTLVTYAAPEPVPQWSIAPQEPEEPPPSAAIMGLTIGAAAVARPGATAGSRMVPRKQITAADMMRTKRQGSAASRTALSATSSAASASASASATAAPRAAAPAQPFDRTQFNLVVPPSSGGAGAGTGTGSDAGNGLMDGDLDEEANAAEFAQARLEFLRSLQPDDGGPAHHSAASESSSAAGEASSAAVSSASDEFASTLVAVPAALPSNWWEQGEDDEAAAATTAAAPGSLLNGPAFDENDSAGAFQAARAQWMQDQQQHAAAAVAEPASATATPRSAASSSPSSAAAAAAPFSSAGGASAAASAAASSAAAAPAKSSCYHCYKLFATSSGHFDARDTAKWYCGVACADAARDELRVRCMLCGARVRRKDAIPLDADGGPDADADAGAGPAAERRWTCNKCAASAAPSAAAASAASSAASTATPAAAPADSASAAGDHGEPLLSLFGNDDPRDLFSSLRSVDPHAQRSLAFGAPPTVNPSAASVASASVNAPGAAGLSSQHDSARPSAASRASSLLDSALAEGSVSAWDD